MPLVSGGHILFGLNADLRMYSMKTRFLLKKHENMSIASVKKMTFYFFECNAEIAQKGGPSDTYPPLQDAILAHGELAWPLVNESTPPRFQKP